MCDVKCKDYLLLCTGDNGSGTADGSGTESTKTKSRSKTKKSKKTRSKTEGLHGSMIVTINM